MFIEGTPVEYKNISGIISCVTNECISILIKRGSHKAHDVKVIVYRSDYSKVTILNEK
jgi:hypothetical protein